MDGTRKVATVGALGVLAFAGGALGGGLLNAGAATGTTEDPAHEAQESAAREKAEQDGTARHCPHGDADQSGSGAAKSNAF
jgi:hypothetical protein